MVVAQIALNVAEDLLQRFPVDDRRIGQGIANELLNTRGAAVLALLHDYLVTLSD